MVRGHALLEAFELDPNAVHLNHGSYGAVPKKVQAEQEKLRRHIEADVTTFFQEEYPNAVRASAAQVARRLGGEAKDWVFCENATYAVNSVLSSLDLRHGDEIVTTSHVYGAVAKAMEIWAHRRGARYVSAAIPVFLEADEQVVQAVNRALSGRTRLLVIDHITSATATIFPVAALVAAAHVRGVPVLVDGAHAPGHLPLDVPTLAADWYTGNAHKWLFAPRGCGILWTNPARQGATRPVVLSHGSQAGYTEAFDWVGTRDVTPWLCFDAAARAHEGWGGTALMAANRALAVEASDLLAKRLKARPSAPASMRGAMATLALGPVPAGSDVAPGLRQRLRKEHAITAPIAEFDGQIWVRISAQLYNELEDYERLAAALETLIPKMTA